MGKTDIRTNEYMADNARFADLFNFFLHDGKQVINPDKLREMDRTALALPFGDNQDISETVQKYRDVFKLLAAMEDDEAIYILLGVEDQTNVHYAMPVRSMFYDAAQYVKQVEDAAKRHRRKKNESNKNAENGEIENVSHSSSEFLSGFYKEDKLIPVITLVVYWSPDKWDGPQSIHEMLAISDGSLLKFIPDYKINLLELGEIKDIDFKKFQTSLAEVFQFIKYSKDDEKLENIVSENSEFTHMDRRTVELINTVTNLELEITEDKEELNMCLAIEEMKKKAREEERKELIEEMLKNGMSVEAISKFCNLPIETVRSISEKNLTVV